MLPLGVLAQQQQAGYFPAPDIEFVASNFVYPNTSGAVVVNKPAGTQTGDLMIAQVNTRNSYMTAVSGGWTPLWQHGIGATGGFQGRGGAYNEETHAFYRFAEAGEPASYSFTCSSSGNGFGITTFRNVDTIQFTDGVDNAPNTNVAPSIYGSVGDMLVAINGTSYEAVGIPTSPTGMTYGDGVYDAGYDVGTSLAYQTITAGGAQGTKTFTINLWNTYAVAACILLTKAPDIGTPPVWTPNAIPGLQTWLDASDPGEIANTWVDKSGSGRGNWVKHPSYNMPPLNSPTYGLGVAYFANSHVLNGPSYADMAEGEIFVRLSNASTSDQGLWYFSNKSDNGDWYPYGGSSAYLGWGQNSRPSFSIGTPFDTMHTLNIYSKTNDWAAIVNGSVRATDTSTTVGFVSNPYIGKMAAASYFYYGYIKEICIFNRKLTTEERAQMTAYLEPPTLLDKVKEIGGLKLLLDSSEPGDVPNQWSDLSGNENHYVPGSMPTNTADGFYFDGTNYLNGPDFSSLTGGEMLIKMKNTADAGSPGVVWFGTDPSLGNHHPYTPNNAFYDGFGSTTRKGGFGSAYTNLVYDWHTTNYHSFAGNYQMFINGISLYSSGNTVGFNTATQIGKGLGFYKGWMKGIAFFRRKLTTNERAVVQAWLDSL
jgi:hypothetical protein